MAPQPMGGAGMPDPLLGGQEMDPELKEALEEEEENVADAQDVGDVDAEARAHLNLARIRLELKMVDKALASAREAKSLFREAERKDGEAAALEFIAELWASVSAYDKAIAAAERAREQMKRINDSLGEARMLFLAAENRTLPLTKRSSADEVAKAVKSANELLEHCRRLGDSAALGSALCTLSQVNLHREKYKEALANLEEASPHLMAARQLPNRASALLMKARVYFGMDELQKSLSAVQEALKLFRYCKDAGGESACLEFLEKLKEFDFRVDAPPAKAVVIPQIVEVTEVAGRKVQIVKD